MEIVVTREMMIEMTEQFRHGGSLTATNGKIYHFDPHPISDYDHFPSESDILPDSGVGSPSLKACL